jgi:MYXO-CTERM domain-containing protein
MRADWLVFPCVALTAIALVPASADASRVVYVNTDPVMISAGANDPAMDQISVNGFSDTAMDGWAGATPEQIEQLLVFLKDTSVELDIIFTLERPASGPYDMVVFGSADDHASSFGGTCSTQVGISDCGDAGSVSIGFSFWGCLPAEDQLDPHRVAFHTLGALGYGWGLENIAGTGQVMSGYTSSALKWGTACANLNGGGGCTHAGCEMGQQNSSADLLANLGARVDDGPPSLTVLEPQPNADINGPFDVVVDIDDAFGGLSARLELVGAGVDPVVDDSWPYRWNGLQLGAGPVTLRVTAIDADGNETSTDVPVCIGGGCPDGGDGDGDGDPSGDGDGDAEAGGTEGGDAGVGGGRGEGGGCAVARPHESGGAAALLMLGLLGLRRRRSLLL